MTSQNQNNNNNVKQKYWLYNIFEKTGYKAVIVFIPGIDVILT